MKLKKKKKQDFPFDENSDISALTFKTNGVIECALLHCASFTVT